MSLPRPVRMTRRRDFEAVRLDGISAGGRLLALGLLRGASAPGPAFGVIVPKSLGSAPVRNRIKRRLREIVRAALPVLESQGHSPFFCVTIARRASPQATFADLHREWHRLARKTGLWPSGHPTPRPPSRAVPPSDVPVPPDSGRGRAIASP